MVKVRRDPNVPSSAYSDARRTALAVNPSVIKLRHLTPQRRQRLLKHVRTLTHIRAHQTSRRRGTPQWTVTTQKAESIHPTIDNAPNYDPSLQVENSESAPMTSTAVLPTTVQRTHVRFDETGQEAQLEREEVCNDTAELEAMYKEDSEVDPVDDSSVEDDDNFVEMETESDHETTDEDTATISPVTSSSGPSATPFESATSGSSDDDDEPLELPAKPTVSVGGQLWITHCEHGDRVDPNWRSYRSTRRKYVSYPVEIAYQQQQQRLLKQDHDSSVFESTSDSSQTGESDIFTRITELPHPSPLTPMMATLCGYMDCVQDQAATATYVSDQEIARFVNAPLLSRPPRPKDRLAYKMVKLSSTCTPIISDWQ
ncbi:hypothetical protein IWQ62_005572, partial [Dispira parvispora]